MTRIRSAVYISLALTAVLIFARCVERLAGNTSETGNAAVIGKLYLPDGKTPAKGVRVNIRPKKSLADTSGAGLMKTLAKLTATDSVVTDNAGQFVFDTTIDTGTYVITSASGNNAVLIDSVAVKNTAVTDTLASDTLKPAGALKGVISLSEGGDPRKVFVLAFGIDRFARVNADGSFKFSNLAEAKYDLRLISSLDNYGVLDIFGIPIISADTLNMDTIKLPFTGTPTPRRVAISYDTMKQIVTLTWSKADMALVKSYNIYRRNAGLNTVLARINTNPVMDTVYRDSTGVQDSTYEYIVAAVSPANMEGTKSAADSVKVVSAFNLIETINLDSLSNAPISFVVSPDTTFYVAYNGGNNNSFVGVFNKIGHSTKIIGAGKFVQLYDVALDSRGNIYTVDPDRSSVVKFNGNGDSIAQWYVLYPYPMRILIDAQDNLFVLHGNNPCLLTNFDTTGNNLTTDTAVSSVNDIGDMAMGSVGHIFIREGNTNRLLIYDNSLTAKNYASFTLAGFLRAIDSTGNIYMLGDSYNISMYNSIGEKIAKWLPGVPFDRIYLWGNRIYVLGNNDAVNKNMKIIKVFSSPF